MASYLSHKLARFSSLVADTAFVPKAPYRLRELAQWMSEIASVDGATEFAHNLEMVRYGTKISTAQNHMKRIKEKCCLKTYDWLSRRGTRHASAAYWVVAEGTRRGQFWKKRNAH